MNREDEDPREPPVYRLNDDEAEKKKNTQARRPKRRRRDEADESGPPSQTSLWEEDEEAEASRRRKNGLFSVDTRGIMRVGMGVFLVVGLLVLYLVLKPHDRMGPFKEQMEGYLYGKVQDTRPSFNGLPGKMVVVSEEAHGLDDVHFDIASQARAEKPAEVKVIVRLHWQNLKIGRYTNGADAFQRTCRVEVIDVASMQVIARSQFAGAYPPNIIYTQYKMSVTGEDPKKDIAKYLNDLPSR